MGAGKTTLGKVLAQKMGLTFYDLDEYIEDRFHRTIPQISPNQAKADSEIWNDACSMKWQNLKMSSSHAEEAHRASSTTWTT